MCRIGTIFILIVVIATAVAVRHRWMRHHRFQVAEIGQDDSPDVAAALRSLDKNRDEPSEKSWAVRFAQFINDHPGTQWVVGRSQKPCLSEAEASEAARREAVEKVYPTILNRLNPRRADAGWVHDLLARDVREGRLDADRFAESFDRPYGRVWTESVLLDISPARLDPLVDRYRGELNMRHIQLRRHLAAAGVITVFTALAYLLINSLTRGYFTLRLRVAAMVVIAAAIVILV